MKGFSYKIVEVKEPKFTFEELKLMNIVYLENLEQLPNAMKQLGIVLENEADELFDYGFILSQIGPPSNPNWALYYESNSLYKVIDILDGVNFYDLFLVNMETGEEQLVFSKVHLLEDEMEERLSELIGIDLESKQQGIPVFSKYIQ